MTNKVQGNAIAFGTLQQAAEWFALLRSDDITEVDRIKWQKWLSDNTEHRLAWERVESVSNQFDAFTPRQEQAAAINALDAASRVTNQRRRVLKMLTLICTVGGVTWTASQITPVKQAWLAYSSDYSTAIGQTRDVVLADGTQVWLNTSSALNVRFQSDLRRLTLRSGEMLVETAIDQAVPPRPLVVDTSEGRLRALGTRFNVRQLDGMTHLSVFSGAVEITPTQAVTESKIIEAGQQVLFSSTGVEAPTTVDPAREVWAKGVIFADDLTLAEFITELSRYHQGYLACSPEVAHLRVVGAYPLHDLHKIFTMLETALPVKVKPTFSWWVTIQPS